MTTTNILPVIVIGAARSGTNLLRDILTQVHRAETWPCDEINAIWKYRNRSLLHDEFSPDEARTDIVKFIRNTFGSLHRATGASWIIEKTCANSLRVGFVDTVLPEARYVCIIRNGIDAAASAMKRWVAKPELVYTLRKARFVPPSELPFYGLAWMKNRLHQAVTRDRVLPTWGPRFRGMEEFLVREGLAATCAAQWAKCVLASRSSLEEMPESRFRMVRYESLVADPHSVTKELLDFMEVPPNEYDLDALVGIVRTGSVGKGKRDLDLNVRSAMEPHLGLLMQTLGYE